MYMKLESLFSFSQTQIPTNEIASLLYFDGSCSDVTVGGTTFEGITKITEYGGGICGETGSSTNLLISSCSFIHCSGPYGACIGIECNGGDVTIQNSYFEGNTVSSSDATKGGSLYIKYEGQTDISLSRIVFRDNIATNTATMEACDILLHSTSLPFPLTSTTGLITTLSSPGSSLFVNSTHDQNPIVGTSIFSFPTLIAQSSATATTGCGTVATPCKTISAALTIAKTTSPIRHVITALAGSYDEPVLTLNAVGGHVVFLGDVLESVVMRPDSSVLLSESQFRVETGSFECRRMNYVFPRAQTSLAIVYASGLFLLDNVTITTPLTTSSALFQSSGILMIAGCTLKNIFLGAQPLVRFSGSVSNAEESGMYFTQIQNCSSNTSAIILAAATANIAPLNFIGCQFVDCSSTGNLTGNLIKLTLAGSIVTISHCHFQNITGTFGSCVAVEGPDSSVFQCLVENCIFFNCSATGASTDSHFLLSNTTALFLAVKADRTIQSEIPESLGEVELRKKRTACGACMFIRGSAASCNVETVIIRSCLFDTPDATLGSAIFAQSVKLSISDCSITSFNETKNQIVILNGSATLGNVVVEGQSLFDENSSSTTAQFDWFWGFSMLFSSYSDLVITNSRFNTSRIGAIRQLKGSSSLDNVVFLNNSFYPLNFPQMRSNVWCTDNGVVTVIDATFLDEKIAEDNGTFAWITDKSCSLVTPVASTDITRPAIPLPVVSDVNPHGTTSASTIPYLDVLGRDFFMFNLTCRVEALFDNKTIFTMLAVYVSETACQCPLTQDIVAKTGGQFRVSVANDGTTTSNSRACVFTHSFDAGFIIDRLIVNIGYGALILFGTIAIIVVLVRMIMACNIHHVQKKAKAERDKQREESEMSENEQDRLLPSQAHSPLTSGSFNGDYQSKPSNVEPEYDS
ncbi:hypothetical protein BLNAU_1700 [Blattamonas nauphoetae]|uniref:Right handed beta helix domain-containing protein n=1 Tax=Blattamonas nauphoetae TaxID=2049346 RepID=A0ABQ9YHD4_9EUKA|nr:hypothetical protein BLNAU_1700 [Blattamonas nauphoetae]